MTNLVFPLLSLTAGWAKADFLRKAKQFEQIQRDFLLNLLRAHQDTELGQHYRLSEISSIEQFQARLPVQSYPFFRPYIDRMASGQTNVLTPDPLIYFNMTSGSTSRKKLSTCDSAIALCSVSGKSGCDGICC